MTAEGLPGESELIRRFKSGDEEAFRTLFEQSESVLRAQIERMMSRALKRRLSVLDILQEARIVAFDHRDALEDRGPDSFRNWLLGIVKNSVFRGVTRHVSAGKRSVEREISRDFRMDTTQYAGRMTSPSQAAIGSELEDLVHRAMETLPADYRKVLHLTRVEGFGFREVAQRMDRKVEATRKLYGRALSAFTRAFTRMGGGEHV